MYTYKATIRSVYDGDTFRADLELGFGILDRGSKGNGRAFRLMGVNTPEVRGAEKEEGKKVRDYVREILPEGTEVIIRSVKDTSGKYGRYLAHVFIPEQAIKSTSFQFSESETIGGSVYLNLAKHLLANGMATVPDYLK